MRQPIVAGQFYSNDFDKLNKSIETSFENGPGASPIDKRDKNILGVIVPHSKYDYCGKCMAWAYKEIGESEYPDSYIILGGVHSSFSDFGMMSLRDFTSPFGLVKTDKDTVNRLGSDVLKINEDVHDDEHSIEVQLPFLQFVSKEMIKMTPILLSSKKYEVIKSISDKICALDKNLVIIASSDLVHYGKLYSYTPFKFNVKKEIDNVNRKAIELICDLDTKGFLKFIEDTNANICGAGAIAVLMEIIKKKKRDKGKLLDYYNSGDVNKDYENFVGYGSIVFGKSL